MNKTCLVFLGLLLYTSLSFAQTQHLDGPTKLINPRGRTLLIERDDEDSWLTFHDPGNRWYSMGIDKSNSGNFSLNYGGDLNSTQFVMTRRGNIGIGTTNTAGYTLSVGGKIRAEEVKVYTGWADFVFADDYVLPPLAEVEQHIKLNKHLPAIPSEAEVLENGIELGVMNAKLLQKIEELTLYIIGQEKKIVDQEKRFQEQQESFNHQQSLVELLLVQHEIMVNELREIKKSQR